MSNTVSGVRRVHASEPLVAARGEVRSPHGEGNSPTLRRCVQAQLCSVSKCVYARCADFGTLGVPFMLGEQGVRTVRGFRDACSVNKWHVAALLRFSCMWRACFGDGLFHARRASVCSVNTPVHIVRG